MIQYFQEGLKPSIQARLNVRGWELDIWEEAIEKAVNVELEALLQLSFSTHKMNSRSSRGNKPIKKEEKDSKKTKSTDTCSIDISSGQH